MKDYKLYNIYTIDSCKIIKKELPILLSPTADDARTGIIFPKNTLFFLVTQYYLKLFSNLQTKTHIKYPFARPIICVHEISENVTSHQTLVCWSKHLLGKC